MTIRGTVVSHSMCIRVVFRVWVNHESLPRVKNVNLPPWYTMVRLYHGILYTMWYYNFQKTMVIFHGIPWYDHVVIPHGTMWYCHMVTPWYTMNKLQWFSGYGNTT